MQAQKQETPRCFTVVAGCCSSGQCNLKEGSCGCGNKCECSPDALCKRGDIRVKPDLGGSNSWFYVGALVVLSAAAGAAYFIKQQKEK